MVGASVRHGQAQAGDGGQEIARADAGTDLATGAVDHAFNPAPDGEVRVIALGGGALHFGGTVSVLSGGAGRTVIAGGSLGRSYALRNVAHVDLASGTIDSGFHADPTDEVSALSYNRAGYVVGPLTWTPATGGDTVARSAPHLGAWTHQNETLTGRGVTPSTRRCVEQAPRRWRSRGTAGDAAQVEETVIFLQAFARARHELRQADIAVIEPDYREWFALIEMEDVAADDHERLKRFSDEDAPSIKELERKLRSVDRALEWLREEGLTPEGLPRVVAEG